MEKWKTYNKSDFKHLNDKIEVKMNDGKVYSISMIVGVTVFRGRNTKINTDDILFWREKKDWSKYKKLQKHYELLNQYDFEKVDNLEFAISDSLYREEDKKKVEKLFKKLKKHIEIAQENIHKESKKYL